MTPFLLPSMEMEMEEKHPCKSTSGRRRNMGPSRRNRVALETCAGTPCHASHLNYKTRLLRWAAPGSGGALCTHPYGWAPPRVDSREHVITKFINFPTSPRKISCCCCCCCCWYERPTKHMYCIEWLRTHMHARACEPKSWPKFSFYLLLRGTQWTILRRNGKAFASLCLNASETHGRKSRQKRQMK